MADFEPDEPRLDERRHAAVVDDSLASARRRVGEHRGTARLGDHAHPVEHRGRLVRQVVAAREVQDRREGLATGAHDSTRHESVGDVGAADTVASALREHVIPADVVVARDVGDHALGPAETVGTNVRRLSDELAVVGVEEVAEHVHAAPLVARAELHAPNDLDARAARRGERLVPPRRRVVVGDRDRVEARLDGRADQLRGCLGAVADAAVRVQVDRAAGHGVNRRWLGSEWVSSAKDAGQESSNTFSSLITSLPRGRPSHFCGPGRRALR